MMGWDLLQQKSMSLMISNVHFTTSHAIEIGVRLVALTEVRLSCSEVETKHGHLAFQTFVQQTPAGIRWIPGVTRSC